MNELIERAKSTGKGLEVTCTRAVEITRSLRQVAEVLDRYLYAFQSLPSIREALVGFMEMRSKLRELEGRVTKLEEHVKRCEEKSKYGFGIKWKPSM